MPASLAVRASCRSGSAHPTHRAASTIGSRSRTHRPQRYDARRKRIGAVSEKRDNRAVMSFARSTRMTNLLERAISTDDAHRATKIIQDALGIESNEVANYCFPKPGRRIV